MKKRNKTLLINFVYCKPVGHVIEALKISKGFYNANKNIDIHLILNKESPIELAKACKWIKKVYSVNTEDVLKNKSKSKFFKSIPKTWDYILADFRAFQEHEWSPDLGIFHKVSQAVFQAKEYYGDIWENKNYPKELKYSMDNKFTIPIPQKSTNFAKKYKNNSVKICLMIGGSDEAKHYPETESWIKLIKSIKEKIPNTKIYLTGVRKSKNGRTATVAYSSKEINKILDIEEVEDCYDIGLWNQLALIKECDIFIAPHTGFGFLAPCVGTPWLAISRGDWPEYFFNKVPFYSVIPDVPDYPRNASKKRLKLKKGEKIPEMRPFKFDKKIPEVIIAINLLLKKSFTYEKAMKLHLEKIRKSNSLKEGYPKWMNLIKNDPTLHPLIGP